jgi:phage shock protein C
MAGAPAGQGEVPTTEEITMARTLERPARGQGRVLAGVCAALADRFGLSRGLVRVGFIVFGFVGAGEIAYLVGWLVIPKASRGR